jgi:fructokinase
VSEPLLAAVEIGGTKTLVAIGTGPMAILQQERLPTEGPEATLGRVAAILKNAQASHGPIAALGIASFGPLDLRPGSPGWGSLLTTPKPGWSGTPLAATLREAFTCPMAVETDVNAAALGEFRWGAGRGVNDLAYVTVGTGLGGGLLLDGFLRHGLLHPELGHLKLRRHPDDDFLGLCPFHGDCLEGLISGPAIAARLGGPLDEQPADHPFHEILAAYLGQLCAAILLVASVERIIIGGGVIARLRCHANIARSMRRELAGYCDHEALQADGFVVPPELPDSGLAGAFALAEQLARSGCGNELRDDPNKSCAFTSD